MGNCSCKHCSVELLIGHNWSEAEKNKCVYRCFDCKKKLVNDQRMYVNGKFIPKSHPLHKAGRYKTFNDVAWESSYKLKEIKEGFVYIITNPAWPNWVKIGMAIDAEDRLNGYQTSSPNRDYKLEYAVKVANRRKSETMAHKLCKKMGVDSKGEWFNMPVDTAKLVLEQVYA